MSGERLPEHQPETSDPPPSMECIQQLLEHGEVRKVKKAAIAFLASVPKEARGTRLIVYALLLQEPRFTMKKGGMQKILSEASACLQQEETENPEEHLAAAWLLAAFGGELSPEERDRALAAAEPFHKRRASKKQKVQAMTIIAAYAADTEVVTDALRGILAEKDERAMEIAFRRAVRCFITEDQEMGNRLLQEAIEQAPSTKLRDQLKHVREDLWKKQAKAAEDAIERTYREICEAEKTGTPLSVGLLGDSLEHYRLLCGVSQDLDQKARVAFNAGLIAWKCGDTATARGLHAVALDRTELLLSEGQVNPADSRVRHLYDWSVYWRQRRGG